VSGRALLTFGAFGAAFGAACSLTSLTGLSGGDSTDGGSVNEGGPGAEGGGGTDGAGPGDDGSSSPGLGDAGPFCPSQGKVPFCADFDEGDPTKVYENGVLAVAATENDCNACVAALAPPGTLSFTVPDTPDAGGNPVYVRFGGPVTVDTTVGASLRFAMRLGEVSLSQHIDLASVQLGSSGSGTARIYIGIEPTGLGELWMDRPGTSNDVPFTIPADAAWHAYVVTLATSGAALTGTVAIDDGSATKLDLGSAFPASQAWFYLGPSATTPVKPFQAFVDNVVFTTN
jgi:hypothetical protein